MIAVKKGWGRSERRKLTGPSARAVLVENDDDWLQDQLTTGRVDSHHRLHQLQKTQTIQYTYERFT